MQEKEVQLSERQNVNKRKVARLFEIMLRLAAFHVNQRAIFLLKALLNKLSFEINMYDK